MSMVMNLVMLGCTYPILFLLYFFMKLEIGDKKKTVLGIAIPGEFRKDPQVLEICGKFRRDMKFGMIAMLLFPVLFFLDALVYLVYYGLYCLDLSDDCSGNDSDGKIWRTAEGTEKPDGLGQQPYFGD